MNEQWNQQPHPSSSSSASSTPARPRTSKKSQTSTASDSAISPATFLLPPFSAPPHPSAAAAAAAGSESSSAFPPHVPPAAMSGSTTALTHLLRQPVPPPPPLPAAPPPLAHPSSTPDLAPGPPTGPQYRTSAATAQRKLVAAQRARLSYLSRNLTTRLQYASFKVEHGWVQQSLSEVENLYYRTVLAARIRDRQRQAAEEARRRMGTAGPTSTGGAELATTGLTLAETTPNATPVALGKRKARESTDGGAAAVDHSPTQQPPTVSPLRSSSAHPSPANTLTPFNGTPARPTRHSDHPATGSPPSKRVRYNSAHELALGADLLGLGASGVASLVGPLSSFSTSPGKSTGPTLKIGNPSLGGHKQDLFTAHGLVTPPSFLGSALFSRGGGSQSQSQQQPQQQSQGSQLRPSPTSGNVGSSNQGGQRGFLPPAQINGHGPSPQRPQPTPPLTEPGSTPPGRPPQKHPHPEQQAKQPSQNVAATQSRPLPLRTPPIPYAGGPMSIGPTSPSAARAPPPHVPSHQLNSPHKQAFPQQQTQSSPQRSQHQQQYPTIAANLPATSDRVHATSSSSSSTGPAARMPPTTATPSAASMVPPRP